jgi:hypothetical protein
MSMRPPIRWSILAAALLALQSFVLAAPTDAPRRPTWLTFVDGAQRDIDGEWTSGGHIAVLRRATSAAESLYSDIVYPRVWRGIDARVSATEHGLKYSFDVSSGADPRTIHLHYNGAARIELNDSGSLTIDADGSRIVVTRPVAFQQLNGRRAEVPVRFVPFDADVAFSVGSYDRAHPLVIESVTKG